MLQKVIISKHFGSIIFLVVLKVLVLGLNITILLKYIKDINQLNIVIKLILNFLIIALVCYLIQILIFLSGYLPYGSFSPAGWTKSPLPSFGSVSIERGHFGKFMTPMFPLFYYAYIKKITNIKIFILFVAVTLLNISASSYVFFCAYLFLVFVLFYKENKMLILSMASIVLSFYLFFFNQINTLFNKVYTLAILQDDGGGRKFSYIFDILQNFPFGYGYSGSTFRNLHNIKGLDLNNSIVIFFGNFSIFSVFIIFIFLLLNFNILSNLTKKNKIENKILFISVAVSIIIFLSDTLWFVPTVWIPITIMYLITHHKLNQDNHANNIR